MICPGANANAGPDGWLEGGEPRAGLATNPVCTSSEDAMTRAPQAGQNAAVPGMVAAQRSQVAIGERDSIAATLTAETFDQRPGSKQQQECHANDFEGDGPRGCGRW